ncbi:MAG: XRE family transcriptional regulator [Alphaproteobacteria bacterium]|nr:XRE family transcriptional regulator [Alphaproteobacteria bacterium]
MRNAHIITENGKKMAVLPLAEYKRMLAIIETKEDAQDIQDTKSVLARVKARKELLVPGEVVHAIIGGAHPVRAWRIHRGMTAAALAEKAGIARPYLTQIEGRKRRGSIDILRAIAKALRTDVDSLLEG